MNSYPGDPNPELTWVLQNGAVSGKAMVGIFGTWLNATSVLPTTRPHVLINYSKLSWSQAACQDIHMIKSVKLMYWIHCRDCREGPVGMTWDYEMNMAFQHSHLPSRTESAQIPTSPTPILPQMGILITQQHLHYPNSTVSR